MPKWKKNNFSEENYSYNMSCHYDSFTFKGPEKYLLLYMNLQNLYYVFSCYKKYDDLELNSMSSSDSHTFFIHSLEWPIILLEK